MITSISYNQNIILGKRLPSTNEDEESLISFKKQKNQVGFNEQHSESQVNILTYEEFRQALTEVSNTNAETSQRIQVLLNKEDFFTEIKDPQAEGFKHWWQSWLKLPGNREEEKSYVHLFFFEEAYQSNAIAQKAFEQMHPYRDATYYYFRVYDEAEEKEPSLEIRFSKDGSAGEIIHIGAIRDKLSGTEFKNLICDPLCAFANIDHLYLNDSAKITILVNKEGKEKKLKLRYIKPIAEEDGETWYKGFGPATCHNLEGYEGTLISQHLLYYYAAIEKIKQTTLLFLYQDILKGYPQERKRLYQFYLHYLKHEQSSKVPKSISQEQQEHLQKYTLQHLTKAMLNAAKSSSSVKVNQDLAYVYDRFLRYWILDQSSTTTQRCYNLALDTIRRTVIWVKHKNPNHNQSYNQFKSNPHDSFDQLVMPSIKDGAFYWDHILMNMDRREIKN